MLTEKTNLLLVRPNRTTDTRIFSPQLVRQIEKGIRLAVKSTAVRKTCGCSKNKNGRFQ